MRSYSKAVVATIVGLAMLVLTAVPASANAATVVITGGSISLYGIFDPTPLVVLPLPGQVCASAITAEATGTTSGVYDLDLHHAWVAVNPFGDTQDYVIIWDLAGTATYTSSGAAITFSGWTGTLSIRRRSSGCLTTAGTCTIQASNLAEHSTITSATVTGSLPTMAVNDLARLAGENADFDTTVTGSSCGGFIGADNGRVEFDLDDLGVFTVP